jgi:hypothetical protein
MHPPYPRAEMERRVCEAIERGWALHRLEAAPGFPSRQTVFRWAKEDPGFARRLKEAQALRRGGRVAAREAASYNEAVAEALLLRVRRGEAIRDLVRAAGMPGREQLDRWKRERPDFAARLEAAWRFSISLGETGRRRRFDQAAADWIIVRLAAGEPAPQVLGDGGLPGITTVRRWRKIWPEFDAAYRAAMLAGHRVRMRPRSKLTPELADRIEARILAGASIRALSFEPGMPHHVTIYGWMRRDPEFERRMRLAGRFRDDLLAEASLAMVDRATPATAEVVRLQVGELHKRVGRMSPKARREG